MKCLPVVHMYAQANPKQQRFVTYVFSSVNIETSQRVDCYVYEETRAGVNHRAASNWCFYPAITRQMLPTEVILIRVL